MYIWIIHSSFKKYPVENPLAVQQLGLQVSIAGCMWGTKIPQQKQKQKQHKLSNSKKKKKKINSEKELNPKEILILVESANCNNPNTLDTHINVEKNSGMLSSLLI